MKYCLVLVEHAIRALVSKYSVCLFFIFDASWPIVPRPFTIWCEYIILDQVTEIEVTSTNGKCCQIGQVRIFLLVDLTLDSDSRIPRIYPPLEVDIGLLIRRFKKLPKQFDPTRHPSVVVRPVLSPASKESPGAT
jgi:hypothetical protein